MKNGENIDIIFMNAENSKMSESHVLRLKLTDKLDLKRDEKSTASSNLSIYYTWKNTKSHTISIKLKYQLQHGMINLNYRMDHILCRIFKIISIIF